MVCRKGDVSEARAFSSSAADEVSSSVDVAGASTSAVDNRRVCVLQYCNVGVVGLCKLKVRDDDEDAQVVAARRRLLLIIDER